MAEELAVSSVINILITIDTDKVLRDFKPQTNPNPSNPQGIDHKSGYMIATGPPNTVIDGQGTADLRLKAQQGDVVRAFALSASNNFEDAVLLYGMPKFSGSPVFSPFIYQPFPERVTLVPSGSTNGLPPKLSTQNFWFFQANVSGHGTENYKVQFGLWVRTRNNPPYDINKAYGYFEWDPSITVD